MEEENSQNGKQLIASCLSSDAMQAEGKLELEANGRDTQLS
jgi:hypothetical protein